jgi:D-glycero-D-manno-heptose 1,7-bisphosphate phosphatase
MKLFAKSEAKIGLKPALFLDRDGVINVDKGYVHLKKDFEFFEDIFQLINIANSFDFLVIVITNQAGIGRGYYSKAQFEKITYWMLCELKKNNAKIDALYYSPFHPSEGKGKYLKKENTRKPGSGMFLEASKDFKIDIKNSIMIGDKLSDIEASSGFGIRNNYLFNPNQGSHQTKKNFLFHEVTSLLSIKELIVRSHL